MYAAGHRAPRPGPNFFLHNSSLHVALPAPHERCEQPYPAAPPPRERCPGPSSGCSSSPLTLFFGVLLETRIFLVASLHLVGHPVTCLGLRICVSLLEIASKPSKGRLLFLSQQKDVTVTKELQWPGKGCLCSSTSTSSLLLYLRSTTLF